MPRVKLPDGSVVRLVQLDWTGKLSGFTLLFEALVLMLAQQMPFRAAAIFVTEGRGSETISKLARELTAHGGDPNVIDSCSIDMSPAFIRGVTDHLPNASITFDRFHVIAKASEAVDRMRAPARAESCPRSEGHALEAAQGPEWSQPGCSTGTPALVGRLTTLRTACAWQVPRAAACYPAAQAGQRGPTNAFSQWCTNVMRSKVEPMKSVAKIIRRHIDGIVAWVRTRHTNGFLETINGLFQAAKRKARGYTRLGTARTVIFLLAGKLDFRCINPHVYA